MTQSDMVNRIATETGKGRADAANAYNAVCAALSGILKENGSVRIKGIGTLKIVQTKARTARNPKTGASIEVAAGSKIRFVASQGLKQEVSGK